MDRVVVVGSSGSGKSTVARRIAGLLETSLLELDSVFWAPDWQPQPADRFQAAMRSVAETSRWVVEGNYTNRGAAEIIWPRADTIVWLDPSRSVVMWRVTARTLRRMVTREELWHGEHEPLRNLYRWDPEQNIIRWAWTRFDGVRSRYEDNLSNGVWSHAAVHRLRDDRQVERFLAALTAGGSPSQQATARRT